MIENYTCRYCGRQLTEETMREFEDVIMCEDCYDDHVWTCDHCGTRIWSRDSYGDEDTVLCERCYDNNYTRCHNCDELLHNDDAFYDDDYAYCRDCYHSCCGSIHEYSYKPEPIFYGDGNRYFGVELEIDCGGKSSDKAESIEELANQDAEHIYIKSDGSLDDGMELVTHPLSLDYHKSEMPWEALLHEAVKLGYLSHKTSTCGLHVHVNRSTFGETREMQEECISRVLYFVESNWNELLKFSRRSEYTMNRWAARYGYKNEPKEIMEHAKKGANGRYSCVNITNWNTIEFRMFRGTLKFNTIIATLELVNLICDYAVNYNDNEIKSQSWSEFVSGIDTVMCPELIQYLKERRLYVNEPIEEREDD